jgi:hypothetical protein
MTQNEMSETRLVAWEIYYTNEKPGCACNSCWVYLKGALAENIPQKDLYISRFPRINNARAWPNDVIEINENVDVRMPEVGPNGTVLWNRAPPSVILWHEAIGHGFRDLSHPEGPENRRGGSGKDPVILEENNARNCLRLQGVQIYDRQPTYDDWYE